MKRCGLGVVLLVATLGGVAWADLTPEQTREAEALIAQFTAREFARRQEAVDRLVAMGPDVLPLVRKALAETQDAEVKLRCTMVVNGIARKHKLIIEDGKARPLNLNGSHITLDVTDMPIREVLDLLARQSGNAPLKADETVDGTVTIKLGDVPYWRALDDICWATGLIWTEVNLQRPVRVHVPRVPAEEIGAYPGPVAVKLAECSLIGSHWRTRRFLADRKPVEPETRRNRTLRFELWFYIEDRLSVVDMTAVFTKVAGADGVNHVPARGKATSASGWGSARVSHLYVPGTPEDIRGPMTLEGKLAIEFGIGSRELRIDRVFKDKRPTVADGDLILTLTAATRDAGRVSVAVNASTVVPQTPLPSFRTQYGYGFLLVDPKGTRHKQYNSRVRSRTAGRGTVTFEFRNVPEIAGDWALLCIRPDRTEKRSYPFTLRNVPLP